MQIVYLSARPDLLPETLGHVKHFAPFIDRAVVVTPANIAAAMSTVGEASNLPVTVLTDEEVLGTDGHQIKALDHATRNYRLRAAMVRHDAIDDVFIMSDDDDRPLVPIDPSTFVDDEGRHRRYYFHSLAQWRHSVTDYDKSLLHSLVLLRQRGFPDPMCFASHMPQIIDKELYLAVADEIAHEVVTYTPDEWSPYFTLGAEMNPDRFAEPEPFVTLGWPQYPGEWTLETVPPMHVFENHYPELHEAGGMYDGLPSACDPETIDETNREKILRWHRLERQVRELSFPDDVNQPWTTDSPLRKIAFKGLHTARGAYRYLTLDDRARLAELEGRVRRLEED